MAQFVTVVFFKIKKSCNNFSQYDADQVRVGNLAMKGKRFFYKEKYTVGNEVNLLTM
jgi:hypothetical protein